MNTLDASGLIDARRNVRTPFRLLVHQPGVGQVELSFISVLRLLPAKRIVALAEHEGQQVLVKMFLGRTAGKYAYRERTGVMAIARAGVSTPELLWEGKIENGWLLVFRYLPDAVSFAQQWSLSHDSRTRIDILTGVIKILAKLHDHGVIQNDIHLANFLLSEGRINTIDGGAVENKGEEQLTEQSSLKNLALFFAQFFPRFDVLIGEVFCRYEEYRGWQVDEGRLQRFRSEVLRCRESRKRNYIDKTFRDCTRFLCGSRFTRFEVCEREAYCDELAELIDDPDKFIEAGSVLKNGNSSTVVRINLSNRSLVVKRYNIKNTWHGLRRAFRRSRAWQSWSNAHRMEFLGIPALKPIALIENRVGPLRTTAYLITEFIEGPDASEILRGDADDALQAISAILHELSDARISHGDLKATNFVMTDGGPVMVDLDGMKEHKNRQTFEQAFVRDLRRFMDNWQDDPGLQARFSGLLRDLSDQYGVSL
jgi:tRNA A-37 threonylcarbamoyl transferase component Bud32